MITLSRASANGGGLRRQSVRVMLTSAIAALAVLFAADPAFAHQESSDGTAQRVAETRTVLAPSIWYNLSDLGIGCPSTASAKFYPTWTVSNVTSTSAYVKTLKITFQPAASGATLGAADLVNGNGTNQWHGLWSVGPVSSAGVTKTFTFNKTVSFGSSKHLYFIQQFALNGGGGGTCTGLKSVYFYLRPI
ncbi:hypothetical protein [Micromonospora matsumotoense]|uniref:hypothetical protein n=1 Tax=Micromonospora matsumotoense TaxID=121616 RepID=UPI003409EF84